MKILIIYASHYGQTRKIATAIAERLREHAIELDVVDAKFALPAHDAYDAVLLGSRIELGKHARPVVDYLRAHREVLERKPTAFFSVCMAAVSPNAGPDPSGYLAALFDTIGWKPTRAVVFAGGLPYRKYNWFWRFIMKRISASAKHTTDTSRDHEFTDWNAVRAFADELAALVTRTKERAS